MKLIGSSFLALLLGGVSGWDWSVQSKVSEEETHSLSDRAPGEVEKVVVDQEWLAREERIRAVQNGGDLMALYSELETIGDQERRKLTRLICRRWAELDPAAGIVALRAEKDGWQRLLPIFFAEWMSVDPEAAMAGLEAEGNPDIARQMKEMVLGALLQGDDLEATMAYLRKRESIETAWRGEDWMPLMRSRPQEMESLIKRQIENEGREMQSATRAFLKILGAVKLESGPDLALEWIEGFDGEARRYALEGLMEAWTKADPKAVVAKLEEWGSGTPTREMIIVKNSLSFTLARALANEDFGAALDWLNGNGSSMGGGVMGGIIWGKVRKGDVSLSALCDEMDKMTDQRGILRRNFLRDFGAGVSVTEAQDFAEVLQGKEESESQAMLMGTLLKQVILTSPDQAVELVLSFPSKVERAAIVKEVLQGQGKTKVTADFVLALPPEERAAAVAALYEGVPRSGDVWSYYSEVYPGTLAEGLGELPRDEDRGNAMERVGYHWGMIDPDGALEWAGRLSGTEQVSTMSEITRGWAELSPRSVTDYVEGLPAGGARDGAISGLVAGISELDPEAGWLWSETIGGDALRSEARKVALGKWAESDVESARSALENANLPPAETEALRVILE